MCVALKRCEFSEVWENGYLARVWLFQTVPWKIPIRWHKSCPYRCQIVQSTIQRKEKVFPNTHPIMSLKFLSFHSVLWDKSFFSLGNPNWSQTMNSPASGFGVPPYLPLFKSVLLFTFQRWSPFNHQLTGVPLIFLQSSSGYRPEGGQAQVHTLFPNYLLRLLTAS